MRVRKITIHRDDMYCSKCLLKVLMALAMLRRIISIDIDLESRNIFLAYKDERFDTTKVKELIGHAILDEPAYT